MASKTKQNKTTDWYFHTRLREKCVNCVSVMYLQGAVLLSSHLRLWIDLGLSLLRKYSDHAVIVGCVCTEGWNTPDLKFAARDWDVSILYAPGLQHEKCWKRTITLCRKCLQQDVGYSGECMAACSRVLLQHQSQWPKEIEELGKEGRFAVLGGC